MNFSMIPNNYYGWGDFLTGSLLGIYGAINIRQRNQDCSARTLNFALDVADYHKYFDGVWHNFAIDWIELSLKVIIDAYSGYRMMRTCIFQLYYSEIVPWN